MIHPSKASIELHTRAALAFKTALAQLSAVRIRNMQINTAGHTSGIDILAEIDVYCHSYQLACKVLAGDTPSEIETALDDLNRNTPAVEGQVMPVLIAPLFSPASQLLCAKNHAGYIDLTGNARLMIDQVFLAKHAIPHRTASRAAARSKRGTKRDAAEGTVPRMPPAGVAMHHTASAHGD